MKPIKLILKNVGPYRDEKIDFTSLDNMFLIAGNTGSGKTFIFDAITYAIYGKLPSSRVGRQSKLKSTFSTNEECATIEFVFSVSNTKYRIERVLEYDAFSSHTKKLVHKPETMTLEIFSEKTKQFEPLCQDSKISVLNLRAKEIIGLECEEFSKIVVLPQGEFAKFLKDNSNEKKETLSKLFPISSYKEIMEKIKEDADSIKQEINLISTNLVQKKSKIEFNDIQKAIQTLQEKIEFIKIDLEKQNKELKSHEKNLTELNLQKETALQLEQAQKQKEELLQKEDEISILEKKLKSSQLASSLERPFYEKHNAIKDLDEINLQLKNQTEDFNKILNEKNEHLNLQDEFLTKQNEVENLKKEFEKISKQVEKIEELKSLQETLGEHENNLKKINEKKELLEKQINDSKNQVSSIKNNTEMSDEDFLVELHNQFNQTENKLSEINKELLECEKKYELQNEIEELKKCWQEKNNLLEEKQNKYEIAQKIVNENQAILLAQKLKENEPCPVCGSVHHPQPAKQKEISEKDRADFFAESLERITQELNLAVQAESAAQVHLDEKTELLKNYEKIQDKKILLEQKSDLENQLEILNKNIQIVNKFKTDTKIINEKIEELNKELVEYIEGTDFTYVFDTIEGGLISAVKNGVEMLDDIPELSFYRPTTDNDIKVKSKWIYTGDVHSSQFINKTSLNVYDFSVDLTDTGARITVNGVVAAPGRVPLFRGSIIYDFAPDGKITISVNGNLKEIEPYYPRIGFNITMPEGYCNVKYFGMGPLENYPDMCSHAKLGIYETTVDDEFVPYIRPQEFGNHMNTKWALVTDNSGCGFEFEGDNFNFRVSPFDDDSIEVADHIPDLEYDGKNYIRFDYAVSGVGTNSCGPITLDKYTVHGGNISFSFSIKPIIR